MINHTYNRFVQAFLYLMIISAALHIVAAFLHFFMTGDVVSFNFFRIIELNDFYPQFVASVNGNYLAALAAVLIYGFSYIFLAKKKGR